MVWICSTRLTVFAMVVILPVKNIERYCYFLIALASSSTWLYPCCPIFSDSPHYIRYFLRISARFGRVDIVFAHLMWCQAFTQLIACFVDLSVRTNPIQQDPEGPYLTEKGSRVSFFIHIFIFFQV